MTDTSSWRSASTDPCLVAVGQNKIRQVRQPVLKDSQNKTDSSDGRIEAQAELSRLKLQLVQIKSRKTALSESLKAHSDNSTVTALREKLKELELLAQNLPALGREQHRLYQEKESLKAQHNANNNDSLLEALREKSKEYQKSKKCFEETKLKAGPDAIEAARLELRAALSKTRGAETATASPDNELKELSEKEERIEKRMQSLMSVFNLKEEETSFGEVRFNINKTDDGESLLAKKNALKSVRECELAREIQTASKRIEELSRQGQLSVLEAGEKQMLANKIKLAEQELKTDRPASYTRTLKMVARFGRAVENELDACNSELVRKQKADQGVKSLEAMLDRLPNAYRGKESNLEEPREDWRFPEKRLNDICEHLELKVRSLDDARNQNLLAMSFSHPVLSEIIKRLDSGKLPKDGTIILMDAEGKFLAPAQARSPHFIEISRLKEGGVGADGGGFNRFVNDLNKIKGAIILRPLLRDGRPVEAPSKVGGKPVYRKRVDDFFGKMPTGVVENMDLLQILRCYKPY